MTPADKQREYRDRLRGGPPRVLKPCGTLAAFRYHQRHNEPIDNACREAYNAAQREMYASRRHHGDEMTAGDRQRIIQREGDLE